MKIDKKESFNVIHIGGKRELAAVEGEQDSFYLQTPIAFPLAPREHSLARSHLWREYCVGPRAAFGYRLAKNWRLI